MRHSWVANTTGSAVARTIDFYLMNHNAVPMDRTSNDRQAWLIADVGATNSRLAIMDQADLDVGRYQVFDNNEFPTIGALLRAYLDENSRQPENCALAIAAPVRSDDIEMLNRAWKFNRDALCAEIGARKLVVINDFHANACALPIIDDQSRTAIGTTGEPRDTNMAVLGPGSGLGMAAWIGTRGNGCVMSGEGGHMSVAGRNKTEDEIITWFRQRYSHCSAERILSGPGLVALHEAMHGICVDSSEEIVRNRDDRACAATVQQFFLFLGSVAADLALITGAFGGVYIAGGIVPACIDQLHSSGFRDRFEDKNRYRDYMRGIPTYVITHPAPGLVGLQNMVRRQT